MAHADSIPTNVVAFPVKKITFTADNFKGVELITKYDANRTYLVFCQRFLECSPQQMKKKIAVMEGIGDIGKNPVQALIDDFETLAIEYDALSHLFDSAAARLTAVHRGWVPTNQKRRVK